MCFSDVTVTRVVQGLKRAVWYRRQSVVREDWGGWIGESWMFCYWVVMPVWLATIVWEYEKMGAL